MLSAEALRVNVELILVYITCTTDHFKKHFLLIYFSNNYEPWQTIRYDTNLQNNDKHFKFK